MNNRKGYWLKGTWRLGLAGLLLFLPLLPSGSAAGQTAQAQAPVVAGWWLPFIRTGHTTVYDAANNRLVAFGGWNGRKFFGDVWALSLAPGSETWTKLDPDGLQPPARGQHTAIYDAANGRMVIFGGHGRNQNLDDVWALDLTPGAESWDQLSPGGPAIPARRWHTAVYDAGRGQMVVMGGGGAGALLDDLWALDLTPGAEAWSQLAPAGGMPAGRAQHTAIYDSVHQWMVVFGGRGSSSLLNDTWVLNLATQTWTQASPLGPPPPARRGHTAVYDGTGSRMLLFGGLGSGGFHNDLWALSLGVPATWTLLSPSGGPPGARAWHTATVDGANGRLLVIGGRGMGSLEGEAHWSLDLVAPSWSPLVPGIAAGWGDSGGRANAPLNGGNRPEVTLTIEDAPLDTVVNLMRGAEAWFVGKIWTPANAYAQDLNVTLVVSESRFGVTHVGTRMDDAAVISDWTVPSNEGGGRYRLYDVDLEWSCDGGRCGYTKQIVFEAEVKAGASEGYTYPSLRVRGANWPSRLQDTSTARIHQDPMAWIVTSRTGLYTSYDPGEVQRLLDEVFEQAQGSGYNDNPTAVVFAADRFVPSLQSWDNAAVDYANETVANQVADDLDHWLDSWLYYPDYMVILGDDNIIPFYRKHEYEERVCNGNDPSDTTCWENSLPTCTIPDALCSELVGNNYFKTDNPYGDIMLGRDWEDGDLEIAVGRIAGASARDLGLFLQNSVSGPNPAQDKAVLASSTVDLRMPGADNDPRDVLMHSLGYDMNEDLIDQLPTVTDVASEMAEGFAVLVLAYHGSEVSWMAPGGSGPDFDLGSIYSTMFDDYDPDRLMSINRPFAFFHSCRTGLSYTVGWAPPDATDDTMVWSLAHRGASGVVAAAGLSSVDFNPNLALDADILMLDFWMEAVDQPYQSAPLGQALFQAKDKYPIEDDYTHRKVVQIYTFFGVPWMRLPGHAAGRALAAAIPPTDVTSGSWSAPALQPPLETAGLGIEAPAALEATYAITANVDTSNYAISTTVDGFELVEVDGLSQRLASGQVVLPRATLEVVVPLSATVSSLAFTPTQEVVLSSLDIPTIYGGVPIPGGPTGGFTTTLEGTYPATVTYEARMLDSHQLVRIYVSPVSYDATSDEATLYRDLDVQLQYDSPRTLALTYFQPDQVRYVPGETIATATRLVNAGDVSETVTATLILQDPQGQIAGFQGSGAFDVPAGGSYDLNLDWTGLLEGDAYRLRLLVWQDGQVVAGATREVFVSAGQLAELTVPRAIWPGKPGTFEVAFDNLSAGSGVAVASLVIYDSADRVVAFLEPQAAIVPGTSRHTFTFSWAPDEQGSYVASAVVSAGGQEYGPVSERVKMGQMVYLPLVVRNQ